MQGTSLYMGILEGGIDWGLEFLLLAGIHLGMLRTGASCLVWCGAGKDLETVCTWGPDRRATSTV